MDIGFLNRFEEKIQNELLRICTSRGMLGGVLLATDDVTEDIVDALGIVLNTPLPDADTSPQNPPDNVTSIPAVQLKAQVLVPSALWAIVVVVVNNVLV